MLDKDSDMYNLTVEQIAINTLIMLRGKFVTVNAVQELLHDLTYDEALEIAGKCNELLLEMQRYLFRKL